MITVEGIVLKERFVGEQDKFIDVLTKDNGVVELSVKGARKINGKSGSSTQLFAYSRFCVNKRGERSFLNSAEPIHIFYGLRDSLVKISLASYFAEILRFCIKSDSNGGDILRLFLNTLHYLENGQRDTVLLKSIFELRLLSDIGFMPDVVACRCCGVFEPRVLFFALDGSGFFCADCYEKNSAAGYMKLELPALSAVRHIVLSDLDRLFNFRISERTQERLSELSEVLLLTHTERNFTTLDFYKSIAKTGIENE